MIFRKRGLDLAATHEAMGEYRQAARIYAEQGDRTKAAQMHLLQASCQVVAEAALADLRNAEVLLTEDVQAPTALRVRLGEAYLRLICGSPKDSPEIARKAARAFAAAADFGRAGSLYEELSDLEQAARCFEQAGDTDRVEAVHNRLLKAAQAGSAQRQAWEVYRLAEKTCNRIEMERCLRDLVRMDPENAQAKLNQLQERLTRNNSVTLTIWSSQGDARGPSTVRCVGLPILVGRDAHCTVRFSDPGISREHVLIDRRPGDPVTQQPTSRPVELSITDLDSKNGTYLNGVRISPQKALTLRSNVPIGLGQQVELNFCGEEAVPRLRVLAGLRKGRSVLVALQPIEVLFGLQLYFEGGAGWLKPLRGELLADSQPLKGPVKLCRKDRFAFPGGDLEVSDE